MPPESSHVNNGVVEPLYHCQDDERFSATSEVVDAMKVLGYESFRMKQEECIMRILSGKMPIKRLINIIMYTYVL